MKLSLHNETINEYNEINKSYNIKMKFLLHNKKENEQKDGN